MATVVKVTMVKSLMLNKTAIFMSLFFTVALTFVSCDRKTVYAHYEHTDTYGWEKNDTLKFGIPPLKHSGIYHEELGIRHNFSYPFKRLTVSIEQTIYPKGEKREYTANCNFIDEQGAKESSGIVLFQYNRPVANLELQEGDSLHICIIHNMKREILPGISDIGIMLTEK